MKHHHIISFHVESKLAKSGACVQVWHNAWFSLAQELGVIPPFSSDEEKEWKSGIPPFYPVVTVCTSVQLVMETWPCLDLSSAMLTKSPQVSASFPSATQNTGLRSHAPTPASHSYFGILCLWYCPVCPHHEAVVEQYWQFCCSRVLHHIKPIRILKCVFLQYVLGTNGINLVLRYKKSAVS